MRSLCVRYVDGIRGERGIIERVPRIGILGHLDVLGRQFEALKISSARGNLDPVVGSSVKDADWMVGHLGVVDVSRDAGRIECNVGRWINPAWIPDSLKSFESCIKRG